MTETQEVARRAAEIAAEKQATDVVLLDLRGLASFADYFVIATGDSARQIGAIADELEEGLPPLGARLHHREGSDDSGWVLLDYGDFLVHVFGPTERQYYRLEEAWGRAVTLVRFQ
jgi:ribosome-associated protein